MTAARQEKDTFGFIDVPSDKLWGAQTQRSIQNFKISGEKQPTEIIHALAQVKKASALVNSQLGLLDEKKCKAIVAAADDVIAGQHPDAILPHLAGGMAQDLVIVLQPDAEHRVGKQFDHLAAHFEELFFCQIRRPSEKPVCARP